MKFSRKLPLAVACAVLLVFIAGLYGIYSLNRSVATYATTVQAGNDSARAATELALAFKVQVQEWKNTLLRGKNPRDLDKHWGAFNRIEREMAEQTQRLLAILPAGEAKGLVENFAAAHQTMGESYRKGFEAFKSAGFASAAGDAAVAGMDREPAKLLDEASKKIQADSVSISAEAAAASKRATTISLTLMLVVSGIGIGAGVWFSRSIVRQLGGEPDAAAEMARLVANGDLSVRLDVRPGDTTSLMARLRQMQTSLVKAWPPPVPRSHRAIRT